MADNNEMVLAQSIYDDLCGFLDRRNWNYKKHDDDLVVTFTVHGEDIPMDFILMIDADRQLLRVMSKFPFTVPEDKRMDLAIATCAATYRLVDGSFDYDIAKGSIYFRMTASFRQCKIGEGLFEYMIFCSSQTIDDFNDKLMALSKGMISLPDFLGE